MTTKSGKPIVCYGQVNGGTWCQEHYETASHHAGIRAKELRSLGYRVTVESLGLQVTSVGTVRMTMVTIYPGLHVDTMGLPPVSIEQI